MNTEKLIDLSFEFSFDKYTPKPTVKQTEEFMAIYDNAFMKEI